MTLIFYYIGIIILLLIPILMLLFVIFGLFSDILGAPFVPTSAKLIEKILKKANLKKGQFFVELGSGDGRVSREAVKKYRVKALGIEIHPMLVFYSNLISTFEKLSNIKFIHQNFFNYDLSKADVVFMFLYSKTNQKLALKLKNECKKGVQIISHGFRIKGLENYLKETIPGEPFPTYYYKLK